ncbi:TusE/DsrC/DsvC family sulfur relay protein [Abyssogena phaseoliformis symbiont]
MEQGDSLIELATSENITLTDDYWTIFDFMRDYYNEHGVVHLMLVILPNK